MRTRWICCMVLMLGCSSQVSPDVSDQAGDTPDAGRAEVMLDVAPPTPDIVTDAADELDTQVEIDTPPACEPQCDDAQCGDNGCGKICGTCPQDWECESGTCVCVPDCAGKECGKDGCGGACGSCTAPENCAQFGACVNKADATPWTGGVLKINLLEVANGGLPGYALDLDDDAWTCAPPGNCEDGLDNGLGVTFGQVEQYVDLNEELATALTSGDTVLLAEFVNFNDAGQPFLMNMFMGHPVVGVEVCDWQVDVCEYTVDPGSYDGNGDPLWSFPNAVIHDGKLLAGGPAYELTLPVSLLFASLDPEIWLTGYMARLEADAIVVGGELVGLQSAVLGVAFNVAELEQAIDDLTEGMDLPVSPGIFDPWGSVFIPDIDSDGDWILDAISFGLRHEAIAGVVTGFSDCIADCEGKQCGDDGCGWYCGECPDPYDACVEGGCQPCQPDCAGNCGPDGCGGLCGVCTSPDGADCVDGICINCVPNCIGRVCGPDGCLGSCGDCPSDEWCTQWGECVGAPCPIPAIDCSEGHFALPGTMLHLSGADSSSPNGAIVGWSWSVDAPSDSATGLTPIAPTEETKFLIDVAGVYLFHLDVTDESGEMSSVAAKYTVNAVISQGIMVELLWHTPGDPDETDEGIEAGADLDLHLLHPWAGGPDLDGDGEPDGWFDQPFDCYWLNAQPMWGSFDPQTPDDPWLFMDDTDGVGPEGVQLALTEEVTYTVGVHTWNDHGFGGSVATVKVFLNGNQVYETDPTWLENLDMWRVCTIQMPQGIVTTVEDDQGQPQITPEYQSPFFLPE